MNEIQMCVSEIASALNNRRIIYGQVEKHANNLIELLRYVDDREKTSIVQLLYQLADCFWGWHAKLYLASLMIDPVFAFDDRSRALDYILSVALRSEFMSDEETLWIYQYISSRLFLDFNLQLSCPEDKWKLWDKIVARFSDSLSLTERFMPIPYEERNPDFYLVIIGQVLSDLHGPTKSALDRCKVLMDSGKSVLLINTAEVMTETGRCIMHDTRVGNYVENFLTMKTYRWKGVDIPFYQCEKGMPRKDKMLELLEVIYEYKPIRVIDISGTTILGNLVDYFIPTLAVTLGPSDLIVTRETWQTIGRELNEKDRLILEQAGYPETNVIQMIMTFDEKEQTHFYTRKDSGLDESSFQVVIVGGRLDDEVTDEFFDMVETLTDLPIHFNFCGEFSKYKEYVEARPELKQVTGYIGYQKDIMAVYDLMDLYINPIRAGGGTSAQEAMLKGIPVITTRYGDVYVNVRDSFAVSDYKEMANCIRRYMSDREFYESQSKAARELGLKEKDTAGEFRRILGLCEENENTHNAPAILREKYFDHPSKRFADFCALHDLIEFNSPETIYDASVAEFMALPDNVKEEYCTLPRRYGFLTGRIDHRENDYSLIRIYADMIKEHADDFSDLYWLWADERSRNIYMAIVKYWFHYDLSELYSQLEYSFTSYFDRDLYTCTSESVIVDVGAFVGDTVHDLIHTYGDNYKRIYCFEPSESSFEQLNNNTSKYHDIRLIKKAVGNINGVIGFHDDGSAGSSIADDNETTRKVEVTTLDTEIEEPIDVIKMDIGGEEMHALEGARRHIQNEKPVLMICAYHRPADLFDIVTLIRYMREDYQFYLRFNGHGCLWPCDYVIIAV